MIRFHNTTVFKLYYNHNYHALLTTIIIMIKKKKMQKNKFILFKTILQMSIKENDEYILSIFLHFHNIMSNISFFLNSPPGSFL